MATKKNLVKSMLMSILTVGMVSSFSSCRDDLDLAVDSENLNLEMEDEWIKPVSNQAVCNKPVMFINNGSKVPGELQQALNTCFPNKAGSLDGARIVFVDGKMTPKQEQSLKKFSQNGGLVVCLFPDRNNVLWATHYKGDDYYLMEGPDEAPMTDEEGNETVERINKDLDYWNGRLLPFVQWINYYDHQMSERFMTRAAGDVPTFEKLTVNMNNGAKRFEVNYPFVLVHQIDKAASSSPDVLAKIGSISIRFEVMPIYMQSVNGDAAGDYYAVRSTVVPHNSLVWSPFVGEHGACRNRVYGYWFDDMDYEFVLIDPDTNNPVDGLHFYELPYPENSIAARTHSNSRSVGVNGSLSLGYKGSTEQGHEGSVTGSVGFSCNWTESISYELANIDYSRNSSSNWVKYHWYSNNVELKDDMSNYQKYFPNDVHQEFDAKNIWVWHVPYDNGGVKDGSDKQFKIYARVHPRYSSWYHWRGTTCFNSNRKDWEVDFVQTSSTSVTDYENDFSSRGWAGCTFSVPAPDRSTWGVISLKNASSYTMRNVKIYAAGKENKEPVAVIPNTYASQEQATAAVLEGNYTVTFEFINPDNNVVVDRGTLKNVRVRMGKTLETATAALSTGDADLQSLSSLQVTPN